jgi:AcrR family transcriptional regulator
MPRQTPRHRAQRGAPRVRDEARALYKKAILDAAEEVFAARGFHGARVQEIARTARIAVGTIYNHFPQKEDILLALLELRMREMLAVFAPVEGDPAGFADKLAVRLARVLAYRERHMDFFAVAIEHGLLGDTTGAARQILGGRALPHLGVFDRALRDLVDEGVAASALAPLDHALLAAFLKQTIRAVSRWRAGRGVSTAEAAGTIVALFLRGAGERPPSGSRSKAGARARRS